MALLKKLLTGRRFLALTAVIASGLTAAVTLLWNAQLADIIEVVSAGAPPTAKMLAWALVSMLAMGITNYAKGFLSALACETMTHDLRMGYACHFASLPFAEVEMLNAGEQLSRTQNEIDGVSKYFCANLFQLFDDIVRFLTTFIWLLFISPKLTLAANLPAVLLVLYVIWSSKIIGTATNYAQTAKRQMNTFADTLLNLFPVIRLYDALPITMGGFTDAVKAWKTRTIQMERTKAWLMSLSGIWGSIPLFLLLLIGGQMAISGALSVGTLYIFINLSGNISGVLKNMPSHIAGLREFSANMNMLSPLVKLARKGEAYEHHN